MDLTIVFIIILKAEVCYINGKTLNVRKRKVKGNKVISDYMTMYVEKPPKDLTSKLW